MKQSTSIKGLIEFINQSPTPFHVVENAKHILEQAGFKYLSELESWTLKPNQKYYLIKNDSAIIAFTLPNTFDNVEMHVVASHNDSPSFKLKPECLLENEKYLRLNTEPYGGSIFSSFLDRPLGIAGRVIIEKNQRLLTKLVNFDRTVVIPNLAIHLDREKNHNNALNAQIDMLPLVSLGDQSFWEEKIISHDLFLYNKEKGFVWGNNEELISAPRLDDLECVYASLQAIINCQSTTNNINMAVIFSHEEVGSSSVVGAGSNFFEMIIKRILTEINVEQKHVFARSMIISADNAHALHPNHPEKSDITNSPLMNKGIVIKNNASLSYTTNAISESIFKLICKKANLQTQSYTNRSDIRGGGTLGSILLSSLPFLSVDIGLAQLAMHSALETAGTKDIDDLVLALQTYYESELNIEDIYINKK